MITRKAYGGWSNCLLLHNDHAELVITLDVGPRILSYSRPGGENIFKEFPSQLGKSGEKEWVIRGGHRLWIAPENDPCYSPDNSPVSIEEIDANTVKVSSPKDTVYGWHRELEVSLDPGSDRVTVRHLLTSLADQQTDTAPWALSVMAPGGKAIVPLPTFKAHPGQIPLPLGDRAKEFLPNQKFIFWAYTRLSDPRYKWFDAHWELHQDPAKCATKIGFIHSSGWVGYHRNGILFAKSFPWDEGKSYPDGGVNCELFTNEEILEIESLAPLRRFRKGETAEHTETWRLIEAPGIDWTKTHLNDLLQ